MSTNRSKWREDFYWLLILLALVLQGVTAHSGSSYASSTSTDVCRTEDCAEIAHIIRLTMNASVNPCDDFYEFACGSNTLDWPKDAVSKKEMKTVSKYHEAFIAQLNHTSSSMRIAANLYMQCITPNDVQENESTFYNAMENFHKELSDEYVEHGGSWEDLVRFAMLEGRDCFVKIGLGYPRKAELATYVIQPLHSKTSVEDIQLQFTAATHGAQRSSSPHEFAAELSKISQGTAELQYWTLEQLITLTPNINWTTIIGPDMSLNNTVVVYAPTSWLSQLNALVGITDDKVLKTFAANQIYKYYRNILKIRHENMFDSWTIRAICSNIVATVLPRSSLAIFAEKHMSPSSTRTAQLLMNDIQKSLVDLYATHGMFGQKSQDMAIKKILAMRAHIGNTNGSNDTIDNDQESEEEAAISESLSFIDLLRQVSHLSALKKIKQIGNHMTEDVFDLKGELGVANFVHLNTIVLPATFLQSPLFKPDGPRFYLYGLMGSLIGHEFHHSLPLKDLPMDNSEKEHSIRHDNYQQFTEQKECFEKQYSNYTINQGKVQVNGSMTLEENMADHRGVAASFMALMTSIEKHGRDLPLPGLDYSSEQLFFLSYAQLFCHRHGMDYFPDSAVHPPNEDRVRGVVSNSLEFAKAFNCPVGSTMNPLEKCQIYILRKKSFSEIVEHFNVIEWALVLLFLISATCVIIICVKSEGCKNCGAKKASLDIEAVQDKNEFIELSIEKQKLVQIKEVIGSDEAVSSEL